MNLRITSWAAAAALAALAATTNAQAQGPGPGPGMGPGSGMGPGAAASAPRGPGAGPRRGAPAGADYTPGWSLMTQKERDEHRARMRTVQTQADCRAAIDQHRQLMAERAKERGLAPRGPRRDPCAGLAP